MATVEDGILHLNEASARQLVLVRAIDEVDTQGKLLSAIEREQLESEALEASRVGPGGGVDFGHYLQQRAHSVLAAVENRNPQVAALQGVESWRPWLMIGLPLAACVLGTAIDRIDNPQQVNMLSPPLLGVLAWNLAVYLLLVVGALLPGAWQRTPFAAAPHWLSGLRGTARTGRLRADVLARFHQQWLRAAGAQQGLWWKQLLHLSAAGWALGLAFSIVLGGIVREYRVGWESTLLNVGQVHAFLSVLFAPVVALLPFDPFSVADLERMAFRSGARIGVEEARRWVGMYVALLLVLVVAPRVVLAAWAAWRRQRGARAIAIDLREPYFAQVLARVSPARVTLGVLASDPAGREALLRMLREVAEHPPPREPVPWSVLGTTRGDVLRVFEVPPEFRPPASPVAAHAGGGGAAAQAWLHELLGRFKAAPRAQERDAVQAALGDTDLMLLVPTNTDDVQEATRLLHWVAQPALVLVQGEEAPYRAAVQRLGLAAEVLPLARCTAHWVCDSRLLEAVAARLPTGKRAGFERVAAAWKDRNAMRFSEAMRLVALALVRAARDAEEVGNPPVSLRHLVNAAERDAAQRAREGARSALLKRVREAEASVFAGLVQLHRTGAPLAPLAPPRMAEGFTEQQSVDTPQAGMAGAATGAAMGAGIDLLTGGLTLGAATALGAVLGGGAAVAAAAWKNRGNPAGPPQVQLGDELLATLTESLLLAYLAVAHRSLQDTSGAAPASWHSEVVAAVAARRAELAVLWQQARGAADAPAVAAPLGRELESIARGLLSRL